MKSFFLFFLILASLTFSLFTSASPVAHASGLREISNSSCVYRGGEFADDSIDQKLGYVLTVDCIPPMIFNGIFWLLSFAGVVALFLVIIGGFKFMTSGGDQKAVDGAKKTITWAIIGLVFILLSFTIVNFIADLTGLDCLTKFGLIGTCG